MNNTGTEKGIKLEKDLTKSMMTTSMMQEEFGIPTRMQMTWRNKLDLPFYNIGGTVYYERKDVSEWIEKHKIIKVEK